MDRDRYYEILTMMHSDGIVALKYMATDNPTVEFTPGFQTVFKNMYQYTGDMEEAFITALVKHTNGIDKKLLSEYCYVASDTIKQLNPALWRKIFKK